MTHTGKISQRKGRPVLSLTAQVTEVEVNRREIPPQFHSPNSWHVGGRSTQSSSVVRRLPSGYCRLLSVLKMGNVYSLGSSSL